MPCLKSTKERNLYWAAYPSHDFGAEPARYVSFPKSSMTAFVGEDKMYVMVD